MSIRDSELYRAIHRQPADFRALLAQGPFEATLLRRLERAQRVLLVGVGTSYHAAQIGAFMLRAAGSDAWAIHSVDFADCPVRLTADDAVLVISHRGTKRYSAQARARAASAGAFCIGIVGQGAPIADADAALFTVEQERSSAHSKSYTGALVTLARLAVELGAPGLSAALADLPSQAEAALTREEQVRAFAHAAPRKARFVYTGGGVHAWTAEEGALKLKETAYCTAEGMSLEALLHGPLVGLDAGDQLILIHVPGPSTDRAQDVARAARQIGLDVLTIGASVDSAPGPLVSLPDTPELLSSILAAMVVQLLACFLADAAGTNPDSFRADVKPYGDALKPIKL